MVLLLGVLDFAATRPRALPEMVAALLTAVLVLATGALSRSEAAAEIRSLLPVVGFLAAILVFADACDEEGLSSTPAPSWGRPARDTRGDCWPVVFGRLAQHRGAQPGRHRRAATTGRGGHPALGLRLRARPHVYACAHLANTASGGAGHRPDVGRSSRRRGSGWPGASTRAPEGAACRAGGRRGLLRFLLALARAARRRLNQDRRTVRISCVDQARVGIHADQTVWELVSDGRDHLAGRPGGDARAGLPRRVRFPRPGPAETGSAAVRR